MNVKKIAFGTKKKNKNKQKKKKQKKNKKKNTLRFRKWESRFY